MIELPTAEDLQQAFVKPKNTLVILGHPDGESFNAALAEAYIEGAEAAGAPVRRLWLGELDFDPVLHHGYRVIQPLEPDLQQAQRDIEWARHIVVVAPVWWGQVPALLKGFLDRVLLPGFSFQFYPDGLRWKRLLKGRSARLLFTLDGPYPLYRCFYKAPASFGMSRAAFWFMGIAPTRTATIDMLKFHPAWARELQLRRVKLLGRFLR